MDFEILDFGKDSKPDAPSGTGRELASRLGRVRQPELAVPLDQVNGPAGVRGARMNGVQVHSVRLPGFVLGIEAVFGMQDQRLHIRHEAGNSAGALCRWRAARDPQGAHAHRRGAWARSCDEPVNRKPRRLRGAASVFIDAIRTYAGCPPRTR